MGGGKGGSPPPAPDYSALASQQAAANVQAAKQTASLSNPNIVSPWAKQTVTYNTQYSKPEPVKPTAGLGLTREQAIKKLQDSGEYSNTRYRDQMGNFVNKTPDYYESKIKNLMASPDMTEANKQYEKDYADWQASAMTTPTVTQDFGSPEQKAAWEAQQTANQRLAELGVKGIGQVESVFDKPFQYTGPGIQTSLGDTGTVNTNLQLQGQASGGPRAGMFGWQQGGVNAPNYQTGVSGYGDVTQNQFAQPDLQAGLGDFGAVSAERLNAPELQGQFGGFGDVSQERFSAPQLQQSLANAGDLTRDINTSNLAAMPVNAGTTGQQAIMSRLQPQLENQRAALQTQLANQGITPGSHAYEQAMTEQNQRENDLTTQAALQGLNLDMSARQQGFGEAQTQAGFTNQAQQQAFNQAVAAGQYGNQAAIAQFGAGLQGQQAANAAQQQAYQQALGQAQFGNESALNQLNARLATQQAANQAQQQAYQQALGQAQFGNETGLAGLNAQISGQNAQNAAQQQAFQQALASGQFGNEAQQQAFRDAMANQAARNQAAGANFAQAQAAAQMSNQALSQNQQTALSQFQANNAAQNQRYNQMLQAAQFGNTADQQEFQRQLGLYNMPLNQVSALMSGSQVATPQFQGYQGAGVTAAPVFQAGQAQYGAAMDQYNADQAANNALMGGIFGLGGSLLSGGTGSIGGMLGKKLFGG